MASRTFVIFAFRVAALISLLVIIWASLVPAEVRPTVGAKGVMEHMLAYAGSAFLFAIGFAQLRAMLILIGLAVLSGCLELAQLYVPGRNAQFVDAFMSSAGAGLGLLVASVVRAMHWERIFR